MMVVGSGITSASKSYKLKPLSPAPNPELVASLIINRKYHSTLGFKIVSFNKVPVKSGLSYNCAVPPEIDIDIDSSVVPSPLSSCIFAVGQQLIVLPLLSSYHNRLVGPASYGS